MRVPVRFMGLVFAPAVLLGCRNDSEAVDAEQPWTAGGSTSSAGTGGSGSGGTTASGNTGGFESVKPVIHTGGSGGLEGLAGSNSVGGTASTGGFAGVAELPDECPTGLTDLTRDPLNCGACGNVCEGATLATGPSWPVGIAVDATRVYWTTSGNEGSVMSVSIEGGAPTPLATGQSWPSAIAVDGTHVYWAGGSSIWKLPLEGGTTPTRLVTVQIEPTGIAVDATSVYWVDRGLDDVAKVMKVPLDGGTPDELASEPGSSPTAISLDATSVYWANGSSTSDRAVLKVPLVGGTSTPLASGGYTVFGLDVHGSRVFWTTFDLGASSVIKASLDGEEPVPLATGNAQPLALVADDIGVYWANASDSYTYSALPGTNGTVLRVSPYGGATVPVATGQADPSALAIRDSTVYWTNYGDGTVHRSGVCRSSECL